ncbi:MAG: hypothetical protein AAFX94_07825 [Myxococcota bacterium]
MSLDAELSNAQNMIPECVAVGVVDMTTGMLLAIRTVDSHPQEVLDLVAAATADLFQGASVSAIERLFRKSRGQVEDGTHYFNEIIVFSQHLLHVFARSKRHPNVAACFVTRASANIGMVLNKSRGAVTALEAVL